MVKQHPQQYAFNISINQQQLEQIIKGLTLNLEQVQQQVDSTFDETNVFFVSAEHTLQMLNDLITQPEEDKTTRITHGLCL